MDGNPEAVLNDLRSKVDEKISTLNNNLQSSLSWFEEYYVEARAKLAEARGAPTFVPKVRTKPLFLLQLTEG